MRFPRCGQTNLKRFPDRIAADLALATAQRKGRDEKRSFPCRRCGGYHLTAQDKRILEDVDSSFPRI